MQHIDPLIRSKSGDINQIRIFQDAADPNFFFQNSNIPFALDVMTCHPDSDAKIIMSTLVPGSQFNYTVTPEMQKQRKHRLHQHNHFEFMYILKGHMYQIVEGDRYFYPTGSCCLLNRNTLHAEEYTENYVCIFLAVSTDFVSRLTNCGYSLLFPEERDIHENAILDFMENNLGQTHKNTKDFLDFVPKITEKEQKHIVHDIFEQMIYTIINPLYGATYQLQALFCRLIDVLSDPGYYHVEHMTTKRKKDAFLLARIDQILADTNGRISNRDLAAILNYDGSYIGRIIKKATGKSLFEYSMDFTMSATENMLINSDMNISAIMENLHFTNRAHFYKIFDRYFHMTPKQYRESKKSV